MQIEGGRLIDVKDAARDTGTTVTVRDLFFNTPARRKFMRSEATENYHLTSIVTHYALAHPEIAFTLTNNGREILRVSPAKDLKERAYQIFRTQLFESLIPVNGRAVNSSRRFAALFRRLASGERRAIRSIFLSTGDLSGTRRSPADCLKAIVRFCRMAFIRSRSCLSRYRSKRSM